MISPGERALLTAFKTWLTGRFGDRVVELVLFGSRARGEGRSDSDVDVLVRIDRLQRAERFDVLDQASSLSDAYGIVLSPLVVSGMAALAPSLSSNLEREGVRL